MRQPFRLAILECDEPIAEVKEVYGSYGDIFERLFQLNITNQGLHSSSLVVSKWDVVNKQSYPQVEDIDAVLLTGSRHNSYDNDPWILNLVTFLENLLLRQDRIRVVGVCFGHQIAARVLGAEVGRNSRGWELSVVPIKLTEDAASLFGLGVTEIALQQMHRDIVYKLPVGVTNLGRTPVCEIQGMLIENRLCTFQGHPEFNETIMSEILKKRRAANIFDEDTYINAIERAGDNQQGMLVLSAFLRFLGLS